MTLPDINARARKILQAVVSVYLQSGAAVGSRTVTRRHNIDLSPATVRNVMADLEELGLLEQPHTSAGRVPTESGLRFFIDTLLKVRSLSPKEKEDIRARFGGGPHDLEDLLERASRMLSEVTPYVGVVRAPDPASQRFRHIEFVKVRPGRYLCILVTTSGQIENKLVEVDVDADPGRLERIHNYLADLLTGLTLDEMRQRVLAELGAEKNRYDAMVSEALRLSQAALDQPARSALVVVSGKANLIEAARPSDDAELARMRDLLQALEDKETLIRLLDKALAGEGIQVLLGPETALSALTDSSLVVTPYGPGEQPIGVIAVIGPMRMNYGKVMSIVDFTAELVSQMISDR